MKSSILFSEFFGNNIAPLNRAIFQTLSEEKDIISIVRKSKSLEKFVIGISRNDTTEIFKIFENQTKKVIETIVRDTARTSSSPDYLSHILIPLCPELKFFVCATSLDHAIAHCLQWGDSRVTEWQTSENVYEFVDYLYKGALDFV